MELRDLKYFLAVARLKNITRAADELHISQPALSKQIQSLELELDTKLFNRGKKSTTLTESGMLFVQRAREMIELEKKLLHEFKNIDENITGEIFIGCAETEGMRFIADKFSQLHKKFPRIKINLHSLDSRDSLDFLEKGLLDFVVVTNPSDVRQFDFFQIPHVDIWGLLMRRDDPMSKLEKITASDLWNKPLILSRQAFKNSELSHWFQRSEDSLNIVSTYNLIFNASFMIENGLGYAVGYDKLINSDRIIFRPLEPRLEAKLFIVWKKYRQLSRASDLFRKFLIDKELT